jgi:hypothetical protein
MNERIKELLIKSQLLEAIGEKAYDEDGWEPFVKKFAELIALDCMKLCTEVKEDLFTIQDNDKRDLAEMAATFCYEAIKGEFGVEE